ncbi:hypothetical protein F5146DRAFT_937499, partial [Armillaria mellea]
VEDTSHHVISQLKLAMVPLEESAVIDFSVALFRSLGYIRRSRAIRTRKMVWLLICRDSKYVNPDVCILNRDANDIILVQEDKRFGDTHARLIAATIAAF